MHSPSLALHTPTYGVASYNSHKFDGHGELQACKSTRIHGPDGHRHKTPSVTRTTISAGPRPAQAQLPGPGQDKLSLLSKPCKRLRGHPPTLAACPARHWLCWPRSIWPARAFSSAASQVQPSAAK
ncbi:uncharacterized protein E0L32_007778 [Thyridium curvatum]|uniref:Uncharacterized protein n=1 Tax=Thyridium curvatum TaxID=1093900 RepID=A0A507AVR5_9PEZI|nr:uncharacterized protein E0L32_007778 [Thyridium curvatum]TPX11567.1 hypothetical protein E0L32_007778 [Thyridium curvatum]